ncbi:hypothetical protein CVT24_006118 [Panaeolus cyanescens]|uniref:Phosphoglycerate mutase-like protein n=1 Tax=Panaeolus cyanescens TaxID=181874 RepID=A0A409V8U0_9AGAR|nr:hypothetical protein CVT24_006118 [Panaeolus cyanescens]
MGEIPISRPTPRLFVIRHGKGDRVVKKRETLFKTGLSDIPLTPRGEHQVKKNAETFVGPGLLLDPANLTKALISPRQRAYKTFQLLFQHLSLLPEHDISEQVGEWNYGEYEGLKPAEIKAINPSWIIWQDGCPGGESVNDMVSRVDGVIREIREYHRKYHEEGIGGRDVLVVAHGHLSRVLIARWINMPITLGKDFLVGPGSVS